MRLLERITLLPILVVAAMVTGCDETAPRGPGSIRVAANLSGHPQEPLFIPFGVSIDNGTPHRALSGTPLIVQENGLAPGVHVVQIVEIDDFDIPASCGERPREEVELRGGDTADVVIEVECARTTGDVRVSTITTGSSIDPNGYIVLLNQQPRGNVPSNASSMLQFLLPGSYSISLADVALNCTGGGAQNVQVVAGSQTTVVFNLTCAPTAVLRFVASTTGADRDPDGPVVQIDNSPAERLPSNGVVHVRVPLGTRSYTITDVQPNCTLGEAATGTRTLAQNDTATIAIDASCTAIGYGSVGVTTTDATGDTLANAASNATPAFDVLGMSGRYETGFLIVVVRFNRAVVSAIQSAAGSVYGFMQFDVDESVSTGVSPASNAYGGNATMGADYLLELFGTDTASTGLVQTSPESGFFGVIGRVRTRFEGDSMIVSLPLNKFNNDREMAMTLVVGTLDRPTDVAPNTGTFLLRPPAAVVAETTVRLRGEPVVRGRALRPESARAWRRLAP